MAILIAAEIVRQQLLGRDPVSTVRLFLTTALRRVIYLLNKAIIGSPEAITRPIPATSRQQKETPESAAARHSDLAQQANDHPQAQWRTPQRGWRLR
jgi:hypothetical protein